MKIPLFFTAKNYPFGVSLLFFEYEYYGKPEKIKLLLPTHIFKMLEIKPRDGEFRNGKQFKFIGERKILKDLFSYFTHGNRKDNEVQCTLIHEHTQTKVFLDLFQRENNIEMLFEHRSG